MSRLNRIQSEIKQLEGGRFQKLCDMYLYRKRNWDNITPLGSMDSTDKTTKGTPDTYIHDKESNSYILVMYGTRENAASKLESDIKDAIEKVKIDKTYIKEIICCHASSNLTVESDKKLRDLAGTIKLTIIGIGTLSQDLLNINYQDIVKDLLGIEETTEQVWGINEFISIHDNSMTNAPLNISYIRNEGLFEEAIKVLDNYQILLLTGKPGMGKTKLATEICKSLTSIGNVICVKSNNLPAYQDVKDALDNKFVNYLFLDDANLISNIAAIANLLRLEEYKQKLKIIITIRDYALSQFIPIINSFKYKICEIPLMKEDEIEVLINNINELSSRNVRKIKELSHNNPRTAVIAAIMSKDKKYNFIDSGKEIMDSYYAKIIEDNNLSQDEKNVLFVLSFKQKVNLTNKKSIEDILYFLKLDFNNFKNALFQLHTKELCDIYKDKAIKISDQSLSDYIIINYIAFHKIYKIREIFNSLYPEYKNEITGMLALICNFQSSEEWIDYLTQEMNYIYKENILTNDKEAFLVQFGTLLPYESLLYIQTEIQKNNYTEFKISQKEFESKLNNSIINDPIINILCTLSHGDKFKEAGILLIDYFLRRQDKISEIFLAIKYNFNIEERKNDELIKRNSILEIFFNLENITEIRALLIANIADDFLNFHGESYTFDGKNGILNQYIFEDGEYLIKHHKKIFDLLFKMYILGYEEVNHFIDNLLLNYPIYKVKNGFFYTISSDLNYIENLFFKDLGNLNLREEAIVSELNKMSKTIGTYSNSFTTYKPSCEQQIYNIFSSKNVDYKINNFDYVNTQKIRTDNLMIIFKNYSSDLLFLFNSLREYQLDELLNKWELEESTMLLYSNLDYKDKVRMLRALLESDFILTYYHYDSFMEKISYEDGRNILKNIEKEIDEGWYLSNLLSCKKIDKSSIDELILLLKNQKYCPKINSFNILSFKNFIEKDSKILYELEQKYKEGEILGRFFIPHYISEDKAEIIVSIIGETKLKEIYLETFDKEDIDVSGEFFKVLLKSRDSNFVYSFLIKLYKLRLNNVYLPVDAQFEFIWDSPVADEAISKYLEFLIQNKCVIFMGFDHYLEKIFEENIERALNIIEKQVIKISDEDTLSDLYNLSLQIFDDETLMHIFELLKNKEVSPQFFEKLFLVSRPRGWLGSQVPFIEKDIQFLINLRDIFNDPKYLSHILVINGSIDLLKNKKELELLSDYLE